MARSYRHPALEQLSLPFGPVHNSNLFSNHWLEHRLPQEPEWRELEKGAERALESISSVWALEKKRVGKYENEQSLEYALIQPVLESLGWKIIYQTFLRARKPDYALFLEDESKDAALNEGKNSPAFWRFPTLVADAKAWGTRLDRPIRVNNQREYPPEQIEWYLNQSLLPYGILTNGACWRLVPREHAQDQPRFQTYLECDLPTILDAWLAAKDLVQREEINRHFLRFYLFFSPAGYRAVEGRTPVATRAKEGSSEYRLGIGEDLKMRVFEALRFCIEGFLKFPPNHLDEGQISLCREQSFVFLYRLLFAMYAEDRGLLPYRKNQLYTENRSLGRFRVDIAAKLDRLGTWGAKDYSKEATSLWDDVQDLFDLIDSGKKAYGIPAYNGGLFSRESNGFLATRKISDWHLARVIDQLGRAPDPEHPRAGLYPVDYRDLQIQHLGNIYEGLLELDPHIVTEPRIVVRPKAPSRRHEETTIAARAAIPKGFEKTDMRYEPGDVELLTDKGERRSTGSYYTPNHIVDHLVEKALRPLCKAIDGQLRDEIARTEKELA
ncbi:MAG TPA: hypothetical protein VM492_02240, partial [Sumerlaeia bacterium]|nr:hypothetical protein [Sumerlaeia bacterium]